MVLVSSKTLAELDHIRKELRLEHPVVAENGAATYIPAGYFPSDASIASGSTERAALQDAYQKAKHAGAYDCEAFFELGVAGIVRETGLTQEQAALANERMGSEPILWRDSAEKEKQFQQDMAALGLQCVRGGRFLHLMGAASKEQAVRRLLEAYAARNPDTELVSVSLGDAPNDLGMLATTDIAVIIPGKHDHPMTVDAGNRVLRPESAGPAGWNEAMMVLLAEQEEGRLSAASSRE